MLEATMSELVFKVLVIGDPRVGKTAFVARYCTREWLTNYKATIGADYAVKSIKWSEKESIRLHIWDIAGQDYARTMARTYYKGASGCIIMFDLTNRNSFQEALGWKRDVDKKVFLTSGENIPCILVANKDDLPNKAVTYHEVEKFSKDNGFVDFFYTSVKDNRNLSEAVCELVEKMLQQDRPPEVPNSDLNELSEMMSGEQSTIHLSQSTGGSGGSGGGPVCCYASRARADTSHTT